MTRKTLAAGLLASALMSGSASAQKAAALINQPTLNPTSFLFSFGTDAGTPLSLTLPFGNYAPLSGATFTGPISATTLALTGSVPSGAILGNFSGSSGTPSFGTLSVAYVSGAAPLANPAFTGTATAANLTVSGTFTAAGFQGKSEAAVTPATITAPASGTAPSGATVIATPVVLVTTCSATQPLQLPAGPASGASNEVDVMYYPANPSSAPACPIYPPSAGTVSGASANVAATIAPNLTGVFRSASASAWFQ